MTMEIIREERITLRETDGRLVRTLTLYPINEDDSPWLGITIDFIDTTAKRARSNLQAFRLNPEAARMIADACNKFAEMNGQGSQKKEPESRK
jgi:hypothetical protein